MKIREILLGLILISVIIGGSYIIGILVLLYIDAVIMFARGY